MKEYDEKIQLELKKSRNLFCCETKEKEKQFYTFHQLTTNWRLKFDAADLWLMRELPLLWHRGKSVVIPFGCHLCNLLLGEM